MSSEDALARRRDEKLVPETERLAGDAAAEAVDYVEDALGFPPTRKRYGPDPVMSVRSAEVATYAVGDGESRSPELA
ncbi:hypothetical protein RKD32_003116 [Streptomyces sp. SAI-195]|uniref:hypothetical protein n=1 Tax=unclassified Streptomyces TaxID=2593676 RepID=UPI0034285FFE